MRRFDHRGLRFLFFAAGNTLLAGLFIHPPAYGAARAREPVTAMRSRSGEVVFRSSQTGSTVATVRPGLFLAGWQYRGFTAAENVENPSGSDDSTDGSVIHGEMRSPDGARVTVTSRVEQDGDRIRFRYDFAAQASLSVDSVHVSISLPSHPWIGAVYQLDNARGTVPSSAKEVGLISGEAQELKLAGKERPIVIRTDSPSGMLLQDNRVWGPGGDLEIRVLRENRADRRFEPERGETIAFTLDIGGAVRLEKESPMELQADERWIPLDLKLDIEAGSALDFSAMNDAPAGKHGWVTATLDGHFAFEKKPGERVRFYGGNLCFSANTPDPALAERVADRLARMGYNTIRIHHYESEIVARDASPDGGAWNADALDRFDALFAALKKRGIYMKTDLYVSRPVSGYEMDEFKMATLVSDAAMENWKGFSRRFLTHVNRYTKLAYRDDPALAWICLVNEPNATGHIGSLKGEVRRLFETRWSEWVKKRYESDAAAAVAWEDPEAALGDPMPVRVDTNARGRDFALFLTELHDAAYGEMSRFLREEIKAKALLTYLNGWSETPSFMASRSRFDFIDNHFYWDHPNFLGQPWRLPTEGWSGGGSAIDAGGAGPGGVAMTRLFGKPFSVSEYNYAAPNRFRVESGLLMGAASAIQDWDAVWRFSYSHQRNNMDQPGPLGFFDMATDPIQTASERAAVMLFRRGDLPAAHDGVAFTTERSALMEAAKSAPMVNLSDLTLTTRVGVRLTGAGAPSDTGVSPLSVKDGSTAEAFTRWRKETGRAGNATDLEKGIRSSEGGELRLVAEEGSLILKTPRTVGGIARAGELIRAGALEARLRDARAAVWVSSLDSQPVKTSRRMLLVHGTDSQNTGIRYSSQEMKVLEDWGGLPHLIATGGAEIELAHRNAGKLKVWRLDTSGKRVEPVSVTVRDGKAVFTVSTRAADGKATLYYEIIEETKG